MPRSPSFLMNSGRCSWKSASFARVRLRTCEPKPTRWLRNVSPATYSLMPKVAKGERQLSTASATWPSRPRPWLQWKRSMMHSSESPERPMAPANGVTSPFPRLDSVRLPLPGCVWPARAGGCRDADRHHRIEHGSTGRASWRTPPISECRISCRPGGTGGSVDQALGSRPLDSRVDPCDRDPRPRADPEHRFGVQPVSGVCRGTGGGGGGPGGRPADDGLSSAVTVPGCCIRVDHRRSHRQLVRSYVP